MRVPELDWPDGLFQDVAPVPDLPMMIAAQIQTVAQKPLWTTMLGVWMPSTNADHGNAETR
jgi:hypothetical protein